MAQFPNIFNCDLHSGPVSASIRQMYLGDVTANRVGVRVTDNGEAVALSGTCSGTAMLYNGGTVALTGVVDGNVAYVDLPAAVYSVEGPLQIFVTLTQGGSTTTLLEMRSNVTRTETGVVIDPGTIIPSVAALISNIENAVESIPEDYSELSADVVQLKADMEDVQPAVETLEDDVSDLKNALTEAENDIDNLETGKQDVLTFDDSPTSGSDNPVKSGGVYSAIAGEATRADTAIALKVSKPTTNPNGTNGQLLRTNGDGTTTWVDQGTPTDTQVETAVSTWLVDHPEATTTVQDHSLTYQKFVNGTLDYVMPEMYGAVGDGETDDRSAIVAAINSGLPVVFRAGKTYAVGDIIDMTTNAFLIGYGATILVTEKAHDLFLFRNGDIHVYGLTLVGNRTDYPNAAKSGLVLYDACRAFISDVTIKEFTCHGLIVGGGSTSGGYALVTNVVIKNIGFAGGFSFIYASGSPKTFFANILCENPEYLGEGYGIQAFYLNDGSHTITNFQTINAHIPFDCRSGNAVIKGGYCKNTAGIGVTISPGQTTGVNLVVSDVLFENVHKLSTSSNTIIQIAICEYVSISNCTFIIGSEATDGGIANLFRFYGDYNHHIGPVFIDRVRVIGDKKIEQGLVGSGMTDVADILITNCEFPVLNDANSYLMKVSGTNTAKITLSNTTFKNKTNRMYCYNNTTHDAYPDFTFIPTYRSRGTSDQRPTVVGDTNGIYYDTTLGKLIVWNGSAWKNLDGSSL